MKREKASAGFCIVRPDLVAKNLRVPIGDGYPLNASNEKRPILYRWLKDDEGFQVFVNEKWQDAESIDFDFLSDEKEIIKKQFNGYRDFNAYEEVKTWSAKDLRVFLRHCGYKTWTKDINVKMLQDLIKIHVFRQGTQVPHNPFLVK
jgi:hypothetical protein